MVLNAIGRPQSSGSGVFPALVLVQGNEQKKYCAQSHALQRGAEGG